MERFPWSGQIGLRLLPEVIRAIEEGQTSLSSPTPEPRPSSGFRHCSAARPDWAGVIALHHGSLDRDTREWVEDGIRDGRLRCVVCTSTLDLGVDFTPVDRVLQVGSPKAVGRLIQRAGRSGHQPGAVSRLTCVPTNALELVDVAAARDAPGGGAIESRPPVERPLDLLAQHAVTIAVGGGFAPEELLAEVRTTRAYRDLTDAEWRWVMDFISPRRPRPRRVPGIQQGGRAGWPLRHPRSRLGHAAPDVHRHHRERGRDEGPVCPRQDDRQVEENFIARLRPGDVFTFAGRTLKFVRVRDMTAWVASPTRPLRWCPTGPAPGLRSPLSWPPRSGASWTRPDKAYSRARRWKPCGRSWSSRPSGAGSPPRTSC